MSRTPGLAPGAEDFFRKHRMRVDSLQVRIGLNLTDWKGSV
jgi:hypothetical protein